jgi:RNA polymerase sigma-70 factor (ECF subfamily)
MIQSYARLRGRKVLRDENDEALMLRYQKGEVRAFEVLLERHRKPVFNFLYRHLGDSTLAEDLLQEVFLRVIRGAKGFAQQAKFTTWLYTIARNLCVDNSRRAKFRRTYSLDAPLDSSEGDGGTTMLDRVGDCGELPERRAVNQELQGKMTAAIAALSDDQREVFLMREYLDLPFREIAEIVGCPENTVKSRMRYALEKLRLALEEYRDLAQAAR